MNKVEKILEKEYNTKRTKLVIPEYGRHLQKMVERAISIKDRTERNLYAQKIIGVMGQLQTHLRDSPELAPKLWDHLFIISDFKLDVDSPYPKLNKKEFNLKPTPLSYPNNNIRFKHYGRLIQNMIKKVVAMEEGEKKEGSIKVIANLMKKAYLTWNNDNVKDENIFKDLKILSEKKIDIEPFELKAPEELVQIVKKNNNQRFIRKNKNFRKRK